MSEASDSLSAGPSRPGSPVGPLPDGLPARPYRFNWDAARKPGPGSVISEYTDGRGDFVQAQPRDLLASSSTLSLPSEWTSSKYGFHAISTVLNNPHKRQAPPKAHSHLPIVPPADLPRVRRKDFDPYLRGIASEWDRFQQSSQLGREGAPSLEPPTVPPTPITPATPRTPRPSPGKALPPLNSVPDVFFQPSFNLGDPATFDLVTERHLHSSDDDADPSALSYSLPLLEKLSHHADVIEQHLVREVSARSTSFFAALSNLHDLQSESERCLDRIATLRALLRDVDTRGPQTGLRLVQKECRVANVRRVREGVGILGGVVDMTSVAKGLVNTGQWGQALEVVDEMDALWTRPSGAEASTSIANLNEPPSLSPLVESPVAPNVKPTLPISQLHAFAALPTHLQALTLEIAKSLTTEGVGALRQDLDERIGMDAGAIEAQAAIGARLRDRLRPILDGLVRTKSVRSIVEPWRETVMGMVKEVVQQHLPPGVDVDGTDTTKTEPIRVMSHDEFVTLLRAVYRSLINCVEGLQIQNTILAEVLDSLKTPDSSYTAGLQDDLADILASATELGNARVAKVVVVRAEQHAALDLLSFVAFFNDSWDFVVKCEVICRRMIVGLRGVIVSQAKTFLQAFHQARLTQSAELVHDEQWGAAQVPPDVQHLANVLVDSAVRDPPELLLKPNGISPTSMAPANGTPAPATSPFPATPAKVNGDGSPAPATAPTGAKHLKIEERTYFAVSSTQRVLPLLVDYLRLIVSLPMLTTDTMSRVVEFLKAWNSRTCQVVLGAGAMRSAGLKNITAKHLALASQSLSIMTGLVPYVRETFRRHLNAKQAVMLVEFDKLKRDLQDHQEEIHRKLIQIMGDRLSVHVKDLLAVDWNKDRAGVNTYMEMLVKETVTLHKVLTRWTAPQVVELVLSEVLADIYHRLGQEYSKIELPTPEAKERMLVDARYCQDKLSPLNIRGRNNAMLETIVVDKPVASARPPPSPSYAASYRPPPAQISLSASQQRTPSMSANQRIKGMFAKAAKTAVAEAHAPQPDVKAPPPPPRENSLTPSSASWTGTPSRPTTPTTPSKFGNGDAALPPLPTNAESESQGGQTGFRQVEPRTPRTPVPIGDGEAVPPIQPQAQASVD